MFRTCKEWIEALAADGGGRNNAGPAITLDWQDSDKRIIEHLENIIILIPESEGEINILIGAICRNSQKL